MMQLHLYCPDCLAEIVRKGEEGKDNLPSIHSDIYELNNNGIYKVQCPKGHVGKVVLNNLNFELLYDLGINAIADGYYREAVASMTSALERFYEFFVKTCWRIQGLSFETIDKNWKGLSSQSERQLGAYIFAYSMIFHEDTPLMKDNNKSFRNSVIHKGEIPTREKTIEYAKTILELIDIPLGKLQENYMKIVLDTFEQYTPKYNPEDDENYLTINHPTIIRAKDLLPEDDERRNRNIEYLIEMVLKDRDINRMQFIDLEDNK